MSEPAQAHCERCDHEVAIEHRYSPRLRRALKGYFFMPVLLVPIFPFVAWDYVFFLPVMMLYVVGMGPALSIIRDPATCAVCGAYIPAASMAIAGATPPSGRRRAHAHRMITQKSDHDSGITLRVRGAAQAFAFARPA
jgi:hypothetical protein